MKCANRILPGVQRGRTLEFVRRVTAMRLHLFTCFGFATLALIPGCEGGQTGDLSGQNGGPGLETGGGNCDEHKQKLAGFDEMTDQGTPADVLAYAEKSFEAPLAWKTAGEGQS